MAFPALTHPAVLAEAARDSIGKGRGARSISEPMKLRPINARHTRFQGSSSIERMCLLAQVSREGFYRFSRGGCLSRRA
jgi:hypothetical protein